MLIAEGIRVKSAIKLKQLTAYWERRAPELTAKFPSLAPPPADARRREWLELMVRVCCASQNRTSVKAVGVAGRPTRHLLKRSAPLDELAADPPHGDSAAAPSPPTQGSDPPSPALVLGYDNGCHIQVLCAMDGGKSQGYK